MSPLESGCGTEAPRQIGRGARETGIAPEEGPPEARSSHVELPCVHCTSPAGPAETGPLLPPRPLRASILEMRKDHEEQLRRLKLLKDREIDAVTSATSHTRYGCCPGPAHPEGAVLGSPGPGDPVLPQVPEWYHRSDGEVLQQPD